ncbi:hypothetical protein R6Q59_021452 [Mikania micrantha]
MMVAPMPFPSCIVPNCTINFPCDGRARPPPPPRSQPPYNITNVCNLVWCGEGDCVADGTRRHCRCHNDADNLYDNSANICIRRCSFRADCKNLGINVAPPPSMSPPHTPSPANTLNYRKSIVAYMVAQLTVVIFTSILWL